MSREGLGEAVDSEIHRPVNNRMYITGPELYKVSARNRSYIKPDLRPIDWARAAVELLIPARCSSPFRASDSVNLSSSGQIFGSTHAS